MMVIQLYRCEIVKNQEICRQKDQAENRCRKSKYDSLNGRVGLSVADKP